MDDRYKVCANCCHVTKADDQFYCLNPAKQQAQSAESMKVSAGEKQSCFELTGTTPEPSLAIH